MVFLWCFFRISFFYFLYTNLIFIIFCERLNVISCANYRIFYIKFFSTDYKTYIYLFCNSFFISYNNIVFNKVNFRRFIVFITEIWPGSFPECFIVTSFLIILYAFLYFLEFRSFHNNCVLIFFS